MADLIRIHHHDVQVLSYHDQRVVTLEMIDILHERPDGSARKSFNRHKARFVPGDDYFVLPVDEAKSLGITAPNGLILLTESGYLMLVKPFRDDASWTVQRQLVKAYFRVQAQPLPPALPSPEAMLHGLKACTDMLSELGILDDRDRITFGAHIRQVAQLVMHQGMGVPLLPAPTTPQVWTLSMRLQHLGYPPLRGAAGESLQIKIGSRAAKSYRTAYQTVPPKLWDYVKGQQRQVNAYEQERVDVLDEAIAQVLGVSGRIDITEDGIHYDTTEEGTR